MRRKKRVVIKIGSSLLTTNNDLSAKRINIFAEQIMNAKKENFELIVISSGAISAGFKKIGLKSRPSVLSLKQACAAVGQVRLMAAWEKALGNYGGIAAQILLTTDDLADRKRFLNAKSTLTALLDWQVVPIINENDTIAVDEIKVGDNDTLGSMVAAMMEADLFINFTDMEGLYDSDPRFNPKAKMIKCVDKVTSKIMSLAGDGGPLGTGGMLTKVRAAKRLSERGIESIIANGGQDQALSKILSGESLGTLFKANSVKNMASKKYWLAFATRPKGVLFVDQGAAEALIDKGTSLLPKGVVAVEGFFKIGDAVEVRTQSGDKIAVGLTNYSSPEIALIKGLKSSEIDKALGYTLSVEVIHRDNLAVECF